MPSSSHKTDKPPAVLVERLTVTYDHEAVVNNVSFSVEEGTIAAVIGPNGSGKTTLIKTILGLIRQRSGTVELFGKHLHDVRRRVGYVPQKFLFDRQFPITVREFLSLTLHKTNEHVVIEGTIAEVGLHNHILAKPLGELSGGQLQRILIAQAIINKPDLLILDEPSTGIDIIGESAFYDVIDHLNKDHGTTVILISHDVSMVAQKVDQVICLNQKLLCSGTPRQALTEKTLRQLFGTANVYHHVHNDHDDHA